MNRVHAVAWAIIAVALLTACNTVQGIGQDIKAGGAAIERAAGKTR